MDECHLILADGIEKMGLSVDEKKIGQMLAFIKLIEKWNKAYNLTAIKKSQEMIRLHLLDSLTALPYLKGERIIDVATGAGLPGIPLAICLPHLAFTLLDSNSKKTRFVQQSVLELKLSNVKIVHSRVEDFKPEFTYHTLLTRAFADLADIIQSTRHLLADNGKLIAMKGHCQESELAQINSSISVIPVRIPGLEAERNLVCIENNNENIIEK